MNIPLINRRSVLLGLVAFSLTAKDPVQPVNQTGKGLAVKGYDVVAYFAESRPVKGDPKFSAEWMGATFLFSSAANRDTFQKEPEKYAPQFGGYCAWAVGHGYTAGADPEAWKIVDGKLYLNYNKWIQGKWSKDTEKWIKEGEKNWPTLHK